MAPSRPEANPGGPPEAGGVADAARRQEASTWGQPHRAEREAAEPPPTPGMRTTAALATPQNEDSTAEAGVIALPTNATNAGPPSGGSATSSARPAAAGPEAPAAAHRQPAGPHGLSVTPPAGQRQTEQTRRRAPPAMARPAPGRRRLLPPPWVGPLTARGLSTGEATLP